MEKRSNLHLCTFDLNCAHGAQLMHHVHVVQVQSRDNWSWTTNMVFLYVYLHCKSGQGLCHVWHKVCSSPCNSKEMFPWKTTLSPLLCVSVCESAFALLCLLFHSFGVVPPVDWYTSVHVLLLPEKANQGQCGHAGSSLYSCWVRGDVTS